MEECVPPGRAPASPRVGVLAWGPGRGRWGWTGLPEAQLVRKSASGLGSEEFALLVMGELDHVCRQGGKTHYGSFGSIAGLPIVMDCIKLRN